MKNFLKKNSVTNPRVCIQLLKPESKRLFYSIHDPPALDQVICIDELKMLLLSKNSLCPGIITIISTLITSEKPNLTIGKDPESALSENEWLKDYFQGLQNEIYRVPLYPKTFNGLTFGFVSHQVVYNDSVVVQELQHHSIRFRNQTRWSDTSELESGRVHS